MGDIWISYTEKGLYSLEFPPGTVPEGGLPVPAKREEGEPSWLAAFIGALQSFLAGQETDFTPFPVDYSGFSPFFVRVLEEARRIPYGSVTSYGFLAEAAGRPGASRAAGTCMGRNRLPLVIPCHRVIKKDGTLGGFGSGLPWKERLLAMEGTILRR
jgi:methylated-DNA-[protein]-cysteine S-methyltransferase